MSPEQEPVRKKRRIIVNKNLQLTILLYSVVLAIWATVSNTLFQMLYEGHLNAGDKYSAMIFVPLAIVIVMASTIMFGLLLTSRIAGPLLRLRRHMEEFAEGKAAEKIVLRKDDYFTEIIEPYNKIVAELTELRKK